ncbi:Glycosyl transferase family 2 [Sodalis praecaptivus]|uniref:Glycosyl transferase family 2 n=1 Tax=Sodalis praecaptivus TaxID=1239307 RepID=K7TG02_9GAMM|nr:glycosyltransferase family 2 protein [Sodalis praecaptivus]AFW03680.1 glycosyl transferase family 2 [Sodalis praecaptivus]AHF76489.1 Glycosyl transferase family 2 [Sodalis praecaptivus]
MKIFAICMVKDEIDVLERALLAALPWVDKIFLIDHASTDGTWELIDQKFRHWEKVEVYGQITDEFTDGLRSRAYNQFREQAQDGDWWCRLDSDEFYIDDPREFLAKVGKQYDIVQCASFQYYFTEKDVEEYQLHPERYRDGASIDALKFFACNSSEARFVKHRNREWKEDSLWPVGKFPNLIWPHHIRLKHFQYRYPEQIQHRLDLRTAKAANNQFRHEIRADWEQRIDSSKRISREQGQVQTHQKWENRVVDSSKLLFDDGKQDYVVNSALLDPIRPPLQQSIRNTVKLILGR